MGVVVHVSEMASRCKQMVFGHRMSGMLLLVSMSTARCCLNSLTGCCWWWMIVYGVFVVGGIGIGWRQCAIGDQFR
jgi:hypothetical protein